MDIILLVSKSNKACDALKESLGGAGYENITCVSSAGGARRLLSDENYSLCIIDMPLSDENGCELALYVVQNFDCTCIILAQGGTEEDISGMLEDYGVMVLTKPISRSFFYKMVKFALTSGKRISDSRNEIKKLQRKLDELKIVTRAKLVLMEKLNISETQAHKYIERQAMDQRITKEEVANAILKKYGF